MVTNLVEYLSFQNENNRNKVAVIDEKLKITFGELYNSAHNMGKEIFDACRKTNCPIIVYLEKSIYQYVSLLGVLCSGNYYVPLDTKMPTERLKKIIETLGAELIITDNLLVDRIKEASSAVSCFIVSELKKDICEKTYEKEIIDTDPAYVLFTSGSTGVPKGVTISHKAVIDYIEWQCKFLPFDDETVLGSQAPFYFDASMPDIYTTICVGATLNIIPDRFFLLQNKLAEYIVKNGINTLIWVPSALINLCQSKAWDTNYLDKLRLVMFCGEVMPNKHLNIWRKKYKDTMFVNLYGPTEAAYACTYYIVDRAYKDDDALPIGKACENTKILLINENGLVEVPNVEAELCIGGSCLANGYYNNSEKSQEAFVQNPLQNQYREVLYKTGDIVKYNENYEIMFIGRKDFQIKHNGYRIELGEIETACYQIDGVDYACIIYDEEKKEIVLFAKVCDSIDEKLIYSSLKRSLPKYMLPTKIVKVSEFPLNPNGKIDRKKLREML